MVDVIAKLLEARNGKLLIPARRLDWLIRPIIK
jgi:hypothetical protein